jgi:hypothetical protein
MIYVAGDWIRTKIDGVRSAVLPLNYHPTAASRRVYARGRRVVNSEANRAAQALRSDGRAVQSPLPCEREDGARGRVKRRPSQRGRAAQTCSTATTRARP